MECSVATERGRGGRRRCGQREGRGREDEGGGVIREKGRGRTKEEVWSERNIWRRIRDEVGYRGNEAEMEGEPRKI